MLGETVTDQPQQLQITLFVFLTVEYLINIIDCLNSASLNVPCVDFSDHIELSKDKEEERVCVYKKCKAARHQPRVHEEKKTQPKRGSMCVNVDLLTLCCLENTE